MKSRLWFEGNYIIRTKIPGCDGCKFYIEDFNRNDIPPSVVCSAQVCPGLGKKKERAPVGPRDPRIN